MDLGSLQPLHCSSSPVFEDTTLPLGLLYARSLTNKTFLLNDFLTSHKLDIMLLTETWLQDGESTLFAEFVPLEFPLSELTLSYQQRRGVSQSI